MTSGVTPPFGNKSGDIGVLIEDLREEYENRIETVRMNIQRKYRRTDEEVSIEGIGLAELLKFSNLKMRDFQEEERERKRREKDRKEANQEIEEMRDNSVETISSRIKERYDKNQEDIKKIEEDKNKRNVVTNPSASPGARKFPKKYRNKSDNEDEGANGKADKQSTNDRNREVSHTGKLGQRAKRVVNHYAKHPDDRTAKEFLARMERALRDIPPHWRNSRWDR